MVMTIRNTCRMFDDLFQLVGNREMKSLNSSNISVGGLEPASLSLWRHIAVPPLLFNVGTHVLYINHSGNIY